MAEPLTGVILAGGASRRMAREKARLPWGDATLLEHIIDTLRPAVDEIIVAVSDAQQFDLRNVRVVEDLIPGAHALGGLYTGLRAAAHPRCFVCACDMPFVNPRLVRALAQQARGYDAVIPKTAQGLQPLHAVYATSALGAIEAQLRRRHWDLHPVPRKPCLPRTTMVVRGLSRRAPFQQVGTGRGGSGNRPRRVFSEATGVSPWYGVHALVTQLRAKIIEPDAIHALDPEERSFLNLNSPEEYRRALECGTMSRRREYDGEHIGTSGGVP